MARSFDAIVIGTGQSGPALASHMAGKGWQVAVLERGRFGGTCVNTGCIPTKTLVASARAAHMARRAAEFGVVLDGPVQVDMQRVQARKDEIAGASTTGVENWMRGNENITVFQGHGRFTAPRTVEVNGEALTAERIFINVGGRASVPPIPGLEAVPHLTNSSIMELDVLPPHLVILGGSYIGLEFAQMYRRFGSEVTVIEVGERLIGREDPEVSAVVREILEAEGVQVRTGAECVSVSGSAGDIRLAVNCADGGPPDVQGSHLLVATGRRPNTDDLGLEQAGVETDGRGFITVDDQLRTNVDGIWAIGDVNGRGAFTHTSYNDYEIVAANLFDDDPRRVTDRIPIYGLFVDPPLGRVGMTEQEVLDSGRPALVGKRPMTRVGRARERSETQGFIKVLVDAETHQILGAAILGINGDEVVHQLADVMYAKAPYTVISRAVHIHPTVSELIPTVLQGLQPLEGSGA